MLPYTKAPFGMIITLCALLLLPPVVTHAASDEELTAVREQLLALSQRLDRLEAENHALTTANAKLEKHNQETAVAVTAVNEKTDAITNKLQQQVTPPDWTDRLHWKGDFRYRYENTDVDGKPNRNRNRIRARAALIADVSPTVSVGLGLASGSDDPLSSNQTLGGGGSTKSLNLDLAYFDWSGLANTHIIAGKFSNYIHKSGKTGLLWDGDWRPEGIGFKWDNGNWFANGVGTWIESDSKKEQLFAFLTQAGIQIPVGDALKLTVGMGYHRFDTAGSGSFFGDDTDFFGNSFNSVTNTYLYDYEEVELFADLGFSVFGKPALLFANIVQNQAVKENDSAYAFGLKVGKAKNKGQWELAYVYQELEADSVLGLLSDSDFGGGGTDSRGHKFKGSYAIDKNINAQFAYFINETSLKPGGFDDYNKLQLDVSFKY